MTYTPAELMAVVAARELRDGEVVFVGIGLPNLACNLARATHAPNLVLIYESGAVGAVPERLPVSIWPMARRGNSTASPSCSWVRPQPSRAERMRRPSSSLVIGMAVSSG